MTKTALKLMSIKFSNVKIYKAHIQNHLCDNLYSNHQYIIQSLFYIPFLILYFINARKQYFLCNSGYIIYKKLLVISQYINIEQMTKYYISQLQFQELAAQLLQDLQHMYNTFFKNGSFYHNMSQNSKNLYAFMSGMQGKICHLSQQFDKIYESIIHCQQVICDYEQKMQLAHIREVEFEKKIRCLEEDYLQTYNIIQKHQLQIKTLKAFNNIDASFIPSFQIQCIQEQKERASTRFLSYESDGDSCEFGRCLINTSINLSCSGLEQQDHNEQICMRNEDSQKLIDKQQKNIYDLLVQIDEAGIKQRQISNKISKQKQKTIKIIETHSIEFP